jgi:hypothetical protein
MQAHALSSGKDNFDSLYGNIRFSGIRAIKAPSLIEEKNFAQLIMSVRLPAVQRNY